MPAGASAPRAIDGRDGIHSINRVERVYRRSGQKD